jgi:ankyrin repeat protein
LAWTPLHRAIAFGSITEVANLARTPSVINQKSDRLGHSPWLLAVRIGDRAKIELLAERGADLAQSDRNGRSALHLAAETNSAALPWLLEYGADLHAVDDRVATPLHAAAEHDSIDAVRRLLAAGAVVNPENTYQTSPIHHASSVATLRLLAEAGADLNVVDGCGDWPLKNAAEQNDPERVAWLLAHGAKVDQTSTGSTALHAATQADAREVMAHLLNAGANPNAQDVDGWTPFFSAESREAIHLLRKAGGDPLISDQASCAPEYWLKDRLLRRALTETDL